jgi:hypothetical protein
MIRLNCASSLVDLLSHDNIDIVIQVIETLEELLDEDVGEGEEGEAWQQDGVKKLAEELVGETFHSVLTRQMPVLVKLNVLILLTAITISHPFAYLSPLSTICLHASRSFRSLSPFISVRKPFVPLSTKNF